MSPGDDSRHGVGVKGTASHEPGLTPYMTVSLVAARTREAGGSCEQPLARGCGLKGTPGNSRAEPWVDRGRGAANETA